MRRNWTGRLRPPLASAPGPGGAFSHRRPRPQGAGRRPAPCFILVGILPTSRYGVTWATNVPQSANGVRGPPEMYSPANQIVPPESATAAE